VRVVVHDYAGHPFQVELSRALAGRGHTVLHLYSASITTPRGTLTKRPEDPESFSVEAIALSEQIPREDLLTRWRLEAMHGQRVVNRLKSFQPDVVISANTPLEAQKRIAHHCARRHTRFVYWVQDLIGEAAKRLLPRQAPALARPVASYYQYLERRLLWGADHVVVISADFLPFVPPHAEVIENWAPIERIPVLPKSNDWSQAHDLDGTTNLLYSGTLGMKHDPEFLLELAHTIRPIANTRLVVVSEGASADWLTTEAHRRSLSNVVMMRFQPFDDLAAMLASADVLIGVLGRDAGVFSVPSKVLTYLCAQRPLFLSVPAENLAARIVTDVGAGVVVEPEDRDATRMALLDLVHDREAREDMGRRGRSYAERTFEIESITDRFEAILSGARRARTTDVAQAKTVPEGRAVCVVIVSYRCRDALAGCLASLAAERAHVALDVIVVDNASRDGTVEMVAARFPWVRLIENGSNEGFARAANLGIGSSSSPYVLLLNPDMVVPGRAIADAVDELDRHPDVGMLGVKLVRPDGTFDHACKRGFPTIPSALAYFLRLDRLSPGSERLAGYTAGQLGEDEVGPVDAVNGAFMLIRREAAESVGPMDERYWMYAEDLDWCHAFWKRGWKVLYWPGAEVVHWKGGSSGDVRAWSLNRAFHRSMWLFYEKHHAPRHPKPLSYLVWAGVWARFGVTALLNSFQRPPSHDWSSENVKGAQADSPG
jgi:putative colanic acid biosynthesis glycosyltransferase WcaI